MSERLISGTFVLESVGGVEVTKPQAGQLRWIDEGDQWQISFATSHQFHTSNGEAITVWLRFDDDEGTMLLRQPMGVQSVVTLPAKQAPNEGSSGYPGAG